MCRWLCVSAKWTYQVAITDIVLWKPDYINTVPPSACAAGTRAVSHWRCIQYHHCQLVLVQELSANEVVYSTTTVSLSWYNSCQPLKLYTVPPPSACVGTRAVSHWSCIQYHHCQLVLVQELSANEVVYSTTTVSLSWYNSCQPLKLYTVPPPSACVGTRAVSHWSCIQYNHHQLVLVQELSASEVVYSTTTISLCWYKSCQPLKLYTVSPPSACVGTRAVSHWICIQYHHHQLVLVQELSATEFVYSITASVC